MTPRTHRFACSEIRFTAREAHWMRRAMALLLGAFPFGAYLRLNGLDDGGHPKALERMRLGEISNATRTTQRASDGLHCDYERVFTGMHEWLMVEILLRSRLFCHAQGVEGEEPARYLGQ